MIMDKCTCLSRVIHLLAKLFELVLIFRHVFYETLRGKK